MGIFQEMSTVVNRGRVPLTVRFDGQETVIPVGECQLPLISVDYAKNQNPIMGSADPNNPSISGAQYLIGIKGRDNCNPLTDEQWQAHCEAACRMDWHELLDDRLVKGEHVEVRGKGKPTQARNIHDQVKQRGAQSITNGIGAEVNA